ncbi:hypothetical protein D3C85_1346260 [compost metagenome]
MLSVKITNYLAHFLQQLFFNVLMDPKIIRRNAGLACIREFTEDDSSCRQRKIRIPMNNTRTLASKLQSHRGKMLRCSLHHNSPYVHASGEEDIIKFMPKQLGTYLHAAFYYSNILLREHFSQDASEQIRY